jgi:hypothetical protein
VDIWYLRQHPKVMGLKFKDGTSRVAKLNARVEYIESKSLIDARRRALR